MKNIVYGILLLFLLLSCNHKKPSDNNTYKPNSNEHNVEAVSNGSNKVDDLSDENNNMQVDGGSNLFPDDTYTAAIEYYNPDTGTMSNYILEVEVSDNEVKVIHFNNGGWLDESQIVSGGELDEEGNTTIYTDKGYEYRISLNE